MAPTMLKIRRAQRSAFGSDPKKTIAIPPPPQPEAATPAVNPVEDKEADFGARNVIPLQVRPEQRQVFEQAALRTFEDEMVVHSQEFSPRLCEVLGEEQLRIALRQAMERAMGYGFTNRGSLRLYIEMMFLFGSAFDTDPQYPWAAKILRASDDQMHRAEQLFDKILDYQEKVPGPDGVNTRKALGDLSTLARQPLSFSANDFISGMRQEMTRIFPQKAAYVDEPGLTTLIREGSAEARKHRFSAVREEALLVTLMFMFGHRCTNDPLYPWIVRTLKDEKITEPTARAERLEHKALTWLEHVLASPQEGVQT
jgi:hypothetical protein